MALHALLDASAAACTLVLTIVAGQVEQGTFGSNRRTPSGVLSGFLPKLPNHETHQALNINPSALHPEAEVPNLVTRGTAIEYEAKSVAAGTSDTNFRPGLGFRGLGFRGLGLGGL